MVKRLFGRLKVIGASVLSSAKCGGARWAKGTNSSAVHLLKCPVGRKHTLHLVQLWALGSRLTASSSREYNFVPNAQPHVNVRRKT